MAHAPCVGRTTRHPAYASCQKPRKRIEEGFGWLKTVGGRFKTKLIGRTKVNAQLLRGFSVYKPNSVGQPVGFVAGIACIGELLPGAPGNAKKHRNRSEIGLTTWGSGLPSTYTKPDYTWTGSLGSVFQRIIKPTGRRGDLGLQ